MRWISVLLMILSVAHPPIGDCTTHNLHMLMKHPHYAEGHQHHTQHSSTSHKKSYSDGVKPLYTHTLPTAQLREVAMEEGSDYWSQRSFKDQKALGQSSKTTKTASVVDPWIPQELHGVREASEHLKRVRASAECHEPRPRVVCVRDVYPRKELLPRCTLLHRCGPDAGCCEDVAQRCSPRRVQEVALHFYVLGNDHRSSDVEKLLFENHTECECQTRQTATAHPVTTPSPEHNVIETFPSSDHKRKKCRECPSPFSPRRAEDGRCSCDCFDRHKPCIRVKRGREPLTDIERRCVQAGQCDVPHCDYGAFDPDTGRCPRRPDYDGPETGRRPVPNHRNPNHRWTYFERD